MGVQVPPRTRILVRFPQNDQHYLARPWESSPTAPPWTRWSSPSTCPSTSRRQRRPESRRHSRRQHGPGRAGVGAPPPPRRVQGPKMAGPRPPPPSLAPPPEPPPLADPGGNPHGPIASTCSSLARI